MTHIRTMKAAAVAAIFAMTLTACGQKPGVHIEGSGGGLAAGGGSLDGSGGGAAGGGSLDGSGGGTLDGSGDLAGGDGSGGGTLDGSTDGGATTGETGGGTTSGGGTTGGATGGGSTGGSADGSGGNTGGDTGGNTGGDNGGNTQGKQTPPGNEWKPGEPLTLAIHAPVTGAAPLPTTSFEKSNDLYWKYVTETLGQKVLGRPGVKVKFADDKYEPSSARQVCRQLETEAFLLVGGGGTDQIQACGQYAAVAKVPYFSAGVTQNGLNGNPWYFASSMTYPQQSYLLAQFAKKTFGGKKTAAVITNTPNFDDAAAEWERGVGDFGINYYKTLKHPKGDTGWYSSYVEDLKGAGVEVVYINSSPLDYISFAQKAKEKEYYPEFIGVGITMGLNAVLQSGCPWTNKGTFFSPFPGLDMAPAEFKKAGKDFGKPADDIALALWGIAEQQHELFKRYEAFFGQKLTREGFRLLTENQSSLKTGVFPEVGYSPKNHFGGKQVHVLKADCESKTYKTLATYKSSF